MTVHQESLPPARGRARDWGIAKQKAIEFAGEWVLIFEDVPRSLPGAHAKGKIGTLKDDHWSFEMRTRDTNGPRANIWMRAVPRTEPPTPPKRGRPKPEPVKKATKRARKKVAPTYTG